MGNNMKNDQPINSDSWICEKMLEECAHFKAAPGNACWTASKIFPVKLINSFFNFEN